MNLFIVQNGLNLGFPLELDIPHALVTIYIVTFFWWQRCLRNTPVLIILTILYFVLHDCVEFCICFVDNLHDGFEKIVALGERLGLEGEKLQTFVAFREKIVRLQGVM